MGNQQSNVKKQIEVVEDRSHLSLIGYDIMKSMGEGSYGKVRVIRLRQNGEYYAIKYVDKRHGKCFFFFFAIHFSNNNDSNIIRTSSIDLI